MNNRIYPKLVMEKAIKNYIDKYLKVEFRKQKIEKIKNKINGI